MDAKTDMWKERNQATLRWLRGKKKDELVDIIIQYELLKR